MACVRIRIAASAGRGHHGLPVRRGYLDAYSSRREVWRFGWAGPERFFLYLHNVKSGKKSCGRRSCRPGKRTRRTGGISVLQPIVKEDVYLGQVAVALDRDYVLKQLGLEDLYTQGYDYELWRVEPQNGNKEVVASSDEEMDFSQAQKTVFHLPTQWTLSIQPISGWLSGGQRLRMVLLCVLLQVFLTAFIFLLRRMIRQKRILSKVDNVDQVTGFYNRKGFTQALDGWLQSGASPVILFFFSIEGYAAGRPD